MKEYKTEDIRNIALMGHSTSGKTILTDALLFAAGQTTRIGSIEDGTTTSDYSSEEISRQISIRSTLTHMEWKNVKLNVIDTPGYMDFIGELSSAVHVADTGIITISGTAGLEVGTEFAWNFVTEKKASALIAITMLDKEHTRFDEIVEKAKERFSKKIFPIQFPINEGPGLESIIDIMKKKRLSFDEKGAMVESDIPAEYQDKVDSLYEELVETIAESDDALLEKFFEEGNLSDEEISNGFNSAILKRNIFPLICLSAQKMVGVTRLFDILCENYPSPDKVDEIEAIDVSTKNLITKKIDSEEQISIQIFKNVHEPHIGDLSYFKVMTGVLKSGTDLKNCQSGDSERFGSLYTLNGKDRKEVNELVAGDIGAAVKLKNTHTNDTLCESKSQIKYKEIKFPEPAIRSALITKSKGDEEKIGLGLSQVAAEDPTFHYVMDSELKQTIISGLGEIHLDVAVKKIVDRYGIGIELIEPRVPYRETIRKKATARYRHKKQSGGAGQFGEVEMRLEPLPRGTGIEFKSELVGQNVDRAFVPSIEKGVNQATVAGPLSGNKVIDVLAAVFDGKQHPVDSKDIAFQIAGRGAFKDAFEHADPVLLEPIFEIEVTIPEEYMGDVMGDVSSRRGKVLGMDSDGHFQIIKAELPLANLYKYSTILRSITQGRGFHRRKFSKYEIVPKDVQTKIVEEYRKQREEGN